MTQWQDLSVIENNDVVFNLNLAYNGVPFDFTNYTLSLVLKASPTATDASGITFTVGSGLTVVAAKLGKVNWSLLHANTGTPGQRWWRIDAVDGSSDRTTFIFGNFFVMAA
jgi:hypothetical protein